MQFTGWVPTITGRLSFSRISGDFGNHSTDICNRSSSPSGFVFGVERRVSRDSPLPSPLLRPFGRISTSFMFASLRIEEAYLPIPNPKDPAQPEWRRDREGALVGTVVFAVGARRDSPPPAEMRRRYQQLVLEVSNPAADEQEVMLGGDEAERMLVDYWKSLIEAHGRSPRGTPAFGRAQVRLSRTGVCHIKVDVADLYSAELVLRLRSEGLTDSQISDRPEGRAAAEQAARHIFFFLRDLSHRHYHHSENSDLATMIYPSSSEDDETWRRETQHSLVKMGIAARRENSVASYRQAMGIVAYAQAFQHHLAMWRERGPRDAEPCEEVFPYDFCALRASMEASLGTRESEYAHSREAVVFMVGSIFWILSIIIGSGQISRPEWAHQACSDAACAIQKSFWLIVSNVAANPWLWLIGAAVSALTALIMVRRAFARLRSSRALRSGFSRALDALMASMIRVVRRPVAAWLLTIVAGCGIIFLTAWLGTKFLMHALSVVTPLIAVR